MPTQGDSGELWYRSVEAASDTAGSYMYLSLSPDYKHSRIFMRWAWNYNYAYAIAPYVYFENNSSGSWDTGTNYNRGVAYGYGASRGRIGSNRQTSGRLGAFPCSSAGTA